MLDTSLAMNESDGALQSEAPSASPQDSPVSHTAPGMPETRLYRLSSGFSPLFADKPSRPPKGKNENRQLEYLAQLSLQRRKEQLAADEELERVTRMRQKARHAVARLSSQKGPNQEEGVGAGGDESVPSPEKSVRAKSRDVNRSSSTSRLPDNLPGSSGEAGQLPKYRKSTGTIRELGHVSDGDRSKSASPTRPRLSPSPTSERPKGYRSHTERLQSFIRDQQRKHPLEMISSGAVTKEDRKQRQDQWRSAFDRWKYLNGMPHNAKVFIVRGGYPFIRQALTARGWHENKDSESDFFDYKWTLKTKHLSRFRQHDCQYINHFSNSYACLTTKVGLLTSLVDMHWHISEPSTSFHPRTYNLSLPGEAHEFDLDFKWTAATALLRLLLKHGGFHDLWVPCEDTARIALRVCGARLAYLKDLVEEDINGGRSPPLPELSEDEWNLLLSAPAFQMSTSMHYTVKVRRRQTSSNAASSFSGASGGSQGGAAGGTPGNRESAGLGGSSDESSDESEDGSAASDGASDTEVVAEGPQSGEGQCQQANGSQQQSNPGSATWRDVLAGLGADGENSLPGSSGGSGGLKKASAGSSKSSSGSSEKRARAAVVSEVANALHFGKVEEEDIEKMSAALRSEVVAMLSALRARVTQWDIDGPDNIWIVKPGGKSRGRGIHCFNNLPKLRQQVRADTCQGGQTQQLVAQKYIETPLLAMSRKFDIRQWVLVTCWQPLTVWFYSDCYMRFCAEDYKPSNFDNIFCHLSNNSIAKKSRKFKSEDATGQGNMWTSAQMSEWLKETHDSPGAQWPAIQARMKQIALYTLIGAQDIVDKRNRSFELFGYDFILDTNFKVWLLEVNCSPTFEHSTPITSRLIKQLSEDIIRVTVDIPSSRGAPNSPTPTPSAPPTALAPTRNLTPADTTKTSSPQPEQLPSQSESPCVLESAEEERATHEHENPKQCSSAPANKDSSESAKLDEPLNGRSGTNATAAYIRSLDGLDTGSFQCIFRDVMRAPGGTLWPSFGAAASDCLALQCTAIKPRPKASPARHTIGSKPCLAALTYTAAAATATTVAAAATSSRSPSPTRTHVAVHDQQQEASAPGSEGPPPSRSLPTTPVVSAIAAAAAAAVVYQDTGIVPPKKAPVSQAGGTLASSLCQDESLPLDLHPSQHPQPAFNVQNSSRPQTPSALTLIDAAARDINNATEHSNSTSIAAGDTASADASCGAELHEHVGHNKAEVDTHESHASAGTDGEGTAQQHSQRPSAAEIRVKPFSRRQHQAAGDAAVPAILQCIDSAVSEVAALVDLPKPASDAPLPSAAASPVRSPEHRTNAAAAGAAKPLTLNAPTLFPLTQTAEEILAAHPAATSPTHPATTSPTLPNGELGSRITAAVTAPPEFSSPHRQRAWQEAARLAVNKSKVVQQIRQERAERGQHGQSKTSMKTGGIQKPSEGTRVQERPPAPLPLNDMMSGRLLRAQKQAKARGGTQPSGEVERPWRSKAATASRVEGGFTFGDGKHRQKSQYSSDLFGSKKLAAAAPQHALHAPEWAVAAVRKL